jgi:hypothetical protein
MPRFGRIIASAAVSLSLIASSTAAIASTETAAPTPASDSWVALSMLTPSGTALLGTTGVTAAAAQPDMGPPPVPPAYGARPGPPPIPVLVVWGLVLATIIYIAVHNNHHHPHANSPA